MKISPAREAAFDILRRIETEKAFSSALLPHYEEKLPEADRGLCHAITLGILRRKIYLDKLIDQFSNGKKLDAAVRTVLQIGLYQLLFLDKIPDHAAINESVDLVMRSKKTSAKGFVNAILRRATRERAAFTYIDDIERISVETSHPRWLIEKWIAEFGPEYARKLAEANNEIPDAAFRPTHLFLTTHEASDDLQQFGRFRRSAYVEGCYLTDRITSDLRELENRHLIYFQDEASQMVAQAVGLRDGDRFLDVCASPGSKTTAIAAAALNKGFTTHIAAGDINENRIKFLKTNCRAQDVDFVNCILYDAEVGLPFADESFDILLIDAPCSGTGTIRHNPEIRYRLEPEDWQILAKKQLIILKNASKLVAAGGRIIYSTCSIEKEENEDVIFSFLLEDQAFRSVVPVVPAVFHTSDGFARTVPHRDGMDGFFIAVLEKV